MTTRAGNVAAIPRPRTSYDAPTYLARTPIVRPLFFVHDIARIYIRHKMLDIAHQRDDIARYEDTGAESGSVGGPLGPPSNVEPAVRPGLGLTHKGAPSYPIGPPAQSTV